MKPGLPAESRDWLEKEIEFRACSGPMEAKASHFTPADLLPAMHTFDLTPRPETWVTLNVKQRGVGTASCGPDALDQYKIWPGEYRLELSISLRDVNK